MKRDDLILLVAACGFICAISYEAFYLHAKGAGQGERSTPPRLVATPVPGSSTPGQAGALSHSPEAQAHDVRRSEEDRATSSQVVGDGLGGILSFVGTDELDPGMEPTEEGLYVRTLGQWQQPDFLELTADEARELLPLDDTVPAALPGNLADVIGGLPTRDDVATAYRNPEVQEKLQVACLLELERDAILSRFTAQPGPELAQMIEAARRAYDAAEEDLMRALDRDSGYKNWALLNRLYREFAK